MIKYAGFIDGTNTGDDYQYDEFGNMISDENKGIGAIYYNHLNLPKYIDLGLKGTIEYLYNAQGVKLQKNVSYPNQTQATTRYRGGFQYDNQTLQFVHTAEGYAKHTPNPTNGSVYGAFDYVYNYTDHLGNIRLSYVLDPFSQELKVMEENHYYPFGLKHSYNLNIRTIKYRDDLVIGEINPVLDPRRTRMVSNNGYQYKYNGKEFQDELGLNWYDYQARNYDPALGRWMNIDPLAEKMRRYSPYNYAFDNPVYFIDADGMAPTGANADPIIRDKEGNIVYVSSGKTGSFSHPSGSTATLEIGYVFADDGTPIQVFNNNGGGDAGWDTNCHGTTFTDGKYWLNNDQVPALVQGDNYKSQTVESAKEGDKVVYLGKGNEAEHSMTITR